MTEKIIKLSFDPMQSEIKDIFQHPQARALWCLYKNSHIISQRGTALLHEVCRELIVEGDTMSPSSAEDFLKRFMSDMRHTESSMLSDSETIWIKEAIPFMTGESTIKLEVRIA